MPQDSAYQLAELNIARARYDNDDPRFADFVNMIAPVNAAAERMPGYVWRLVDEDGVGSMAIQAFDDPRMLVNLSVWESLDHLRDFVFQTVHTKVMDRRAEWFDLMESQHLVLWWVPRGHRPSVEEAKARLDALDRKGPTSRAFTFKQAFDFDGQAITHAPVA